MGASDYTVIFNTEIPEDVRTRWADLVKRDRAESGGGAYAGNATTMHGRVEFRDLRCGSAAEAEEVVLGNHNKWGPPLAVSFKRPDGKGIGWVVGGWAAE